MARRSRARYLAPIALAATIAGTYVIVHDALQREDEGGAAHAGGRIAPARPPREVREDEVLRRPARRQHDGDRHQDRCSTVHARIIESARRPEQPSDRATPAAATMKLIRGALVAACVCAAVSFMLTPAPASAAPAPETVGHRGDSRRPSDRAGPVRAERRPRGRDREHDEADDRAHNPRARAAGTGVCRSRLRPGGVGLPARATSRANG